MAIEARIDTLEQRHQQLESDLLAKLKSPGSNDSEIADLKRQKLQIKDTLEQMKSGDPLH
ncbi:MAG: DUF465 domain-containing protein [Rhizobiaceae bacterium]|nr:DUF465 domain-containing protein [Rhizobiaceae bacterium]